MSLQHHHVAIQMEPCDVEDCAKVASSTGQAVDESKVAQLDVGAAAEHKEHFHHHNATAQQPQQLLAKICHLSAWSILGSVLRVYLDRVFGQDCDSPTTAPTDFLSSFAKKICLTNNGLTDQTGGALFTDMPPNIVGSFVLGLVSPLPIEGSSALSTFPWFHGNHPLQRHEAFQLALKVGFCGSLTTFASWNAQMVTMLDGSQTALGPQIVPALFGYFIGVIVPLASFLFGNHVRIWFQTYYFNKRLHFPNQEEKSFHEDDNMIDDNETRNFQHSNDTSALPPSTTRVHDKSVWRVVQPLVCGKLLPFVLAMSLFVCFVVSDVVMGIDPFYRTLWMACLLSPPGTLLRWQVSKLNANKFHVCGRKPSTRWKWLPSGTLLVNVCGSVLSVLLLAIDTRVQQRTTAIDKSWLLPFLNASRSGFCGCLTTISTFCRELVDLSRTDPIHAKPYLYAIISIVSSMLLSLLVYSPIVRMK